VAVAATHSEEEGKRERDPWLGQAVLWASTYNLIVVCFHHQHLDLINSYES